MLFSREELDEFFASAQLKNEPEEIKRSAFKGWLGELKDEFASQIEQEVTLKAEEREQRVRECEHDYLKFFNTYLSHYAQISGRCELHEYLAEYFNAIGKAPAHKRALAAPRGHAKSTHCSVGLVLWCICYAKKRFIVEISDAIELAEANLEAIKVELESNANLRADFGDLVGANWKVGEFITANGIKVKAFGSGKRLRGIRYGAYRPDLAILDDLENDTNVRSKDQRDKLEAWLDEAVLNLGSLDDRMDVLYIGTILHSDSVLARKLSSAFWTTRKFSSIINFPVRMDLWDKYVAIYKSRSAAAAHAYYEANKAAMDAGARVLWHEARDIEKLMILRAQNLAAFNKEQLNEPLSEKQKFKREMLQFYKHAPACDYYVLYCDPAGAGKKSDYTAITVLGVVRAECRAYILESWVKVVSDSREIVAQIIEFASRYKLRRAGIEANGGQFHLKPYILEAAWRADIYMPLQDIHNSENKAIRIEELEMPIVNGEIIFHESQKLLIEQLLEFPEGRNDDAPDSLAGAFRLSKLGRKIKRRTHR